MKKFIAIALIVFSTTAKSQVIFTADSSRGGFVWSSLATTAGYLNGLTLIASKTGVSVASLATTNLDYAIGVSLATHSPLIACVKFGSGTLGIGVIRIKTDAGYMVSVSPLAGLNSTDNNQMLILSGVVRSTGNIGVEVTTASLSASTVSVYVYGVKKL